jgi:hypothetical protein
MILNKFRPGSFYQTGRAFCLQLLALSLFSCNKSANINANKAYVALTHVAYGVDSLNLTLDGDSLLAARVSFGNTSGTPGYPYDTATSRISEMQLLEDGVLLSGNAAFQQGAHYSIFAYDTLDKNTIALLILQDNLAIPPDTLSNFRFLNFSPSSKIGIRLIYVHDTTIQDTIHIAVRDTVDVPAGLFVGYNPNPASYPFNYRAHVGNNQVFAWIDSVRPRPDSSNLRRLGTVQFDTTKTYNLYLQGYFYPAPLQDSLKIKSVQLD